jgi:rSAM/selenodomain-associated transferase 1
VTSALIIFVRNPLLGKVKTRIAKDLGDFVALEVYKRLLDHTHSITKDLAVDRYVFYADFINHDDLWKNPAYKKELQTGSDLGERMENAFHLLLKRGYSKVAIIGSDCFDLTKSIIEQAMEALEKKQVVIGPSLDGGYYLLGMNIFIHQLFENKNWSTESVYDDTIHDLSNLKYSYHILPELSDIDNGEDCKKYDALISLSYQH